MKKEKINKYEKLFTEKHIELKADTKVFKEYHEAADYAKTKRSYVCNCYDKDGDFYGFFVSR